MHDNDGDDNNGYDDYGGNGDNDEARYRRGCCVIRELTGKYRVNWGNSRNS